VSRPLAPQVIFQTAVPNWETRTNKRKGDGGSKGQQNEERLVRKREGQQEVDTGRDSEEKRVDDRFKLAVKKRRGHRADC
jgi:hypothetical protein